MVNLGIGKATRTKHLQILLTISRKINKKWSQVTKSDIDRLVKEIMNEYGDVNGDETESSRDFKKILKLFFRWFKLGSREYGSGRSLGNQRNQTQETERQDNKRKPTIRIR